MAAISQDIQKASGYEMPIYHCSIKIISRTGGRSAVASAAYRSGEKLYNDETGLTHDFTRKGGVIMSEIILPENAPDRYKVREILWNEVQKIEKRSDAQFAREVEVALPTEMTREQQIECVRAYAKENFVDKGMIADWALHDKNDGNPHAHIMLTVRGLDENKKWMAKQKTVFTNAKDEQGRAIYNPDLPVYDSKNRDATSQYRIPLLDENGIQKTRVRQGKGTEYLWEKISIPANDWNDRANAEIWRESWARHCNKYLDKNHQIDHRSYVRQGLEVLSTVHEGITARRMEADGKVADRCRINRDIREHNSIMRQIKEAAKEITDLITEKARAIYDRFKEFGRSSDHAAGPRRDAEHSGKPAGRSRRVSEGEYDLEGTAGRIAELKRAADQSGKETENTDRDIASTNSKIAELADLISRKEADRNERLKKLRERRNAFHAGGDAGPDRKSADSKRRGTADDISDFLRELNAKERAAEEKRNDSISERADREAVRERSRAEAERAAKTVEHQAAAQREAGKRKSKSRDYSR